MQLKLNKTSQTCTRFAVSEAQDRDTSSKNFDSLIIYSYALAVVYDCFSFVEYKLFLEK